MTFQEACARYVHRFTMDHCPTWARHPLPDGRYYAPQYGSDTEWYANTHFSEVHGLPFHCESHNQSWPLGQWLNEPYSVAGCAGIAARVRRETKERRYWEARGVVTK